MRPWHHHAYSGIVARVLEYISLLGRINEHAFFQVKPFRRHTVLITAILSLETYFI